jgi:hypothetical protein
VRVSAEIVAINTATRIVRNLHSMFSAAEIGVAAHHVTNHHETN